MQTGISKAVNCIKIKAKPSIPKIKFILITRIQSLISRNWNCVEVGSKKNNNEKLTFKISKDQKREKLRIKRILVLSIKMSVKQPTNGNKIRNNNIFKKVEKNNREEPKAKKPRNR